MTLSMVDAEMIDTVDVSRFDVVCVYGSRFGSTQGPARPTPPAFIRSLTKPAWIIYFPGADPSSAFTEASSYPNVVGLVMDVESQFEHDAWTLSVAASFGDWVSGRIPSRCYSHRPTCRVLAAHYGGSWYAGEPRTAQLGPADAVQYDYPGPYDVSVATNSWGTPTIGPHPLPEDDLGMDKDKVAAALVALAYREIGVNSPGIGGGRQVSPADFANQVAAMLRNNSTDNAYSVMNNILGSHPLP